MIPILIAGVIITIAGMTSSRVIDNTNESTPVATVSATKAPSSAIAPTVETSISTKSPAASGQKSTSISKTVAPSDGDGQSPAERKIVQPVSYDWLRDTGGETPALCQIKCVYPATSAKASDDNVKVYFATVRANRDVTDRLAMPSAPVPVLCTDSRGRACSPTDVAFFPANYTAIAGKLNNLVPVTYEGRQDILAWYEPSTELVQAFPDSMQDELVTLLDIDIDVEFEMPVVTPFKMNLFRYDSLIDVVKRQRNSHDSGSQQPWATSPDSRNSNGNSFHFRADDKIPRELLDFYKNNTNLEKDLSNYRVMKQQQRNFLNIDSLIGVVKSQMGCVDSNAAQNNSFETFRKLGFGMFNSDSSFKTFKFDDSTFKTCKFDVSTFDTLKFDDSTLKEFKMSDSSVKSFRFRLNTEGDTNDISIEYGANNNQMNLDSVAAYYRQFTKSTYTDMRNLGNYEELMKQPHIIATMRNMDSTMKMLQLYYGSDSLCKMPSELLDQHGVERLGSTPTKKVYKIRKKIKLDSTVNDADSNNKQRFQSRVVIKSTTKRNKNAQFLPSVEKLSELTPTTNGAIVSTSVYPNPATDGGATMSFVLSEPRTLKLTLLDLNGNVVATLMQEAKRTAGNGQFAFTLNNIPSGMYLATLTTDKGERAMQRLIVQ